MNYKRIVENLIKKHISKAFDANGYMVIDTKMVYSVDHKNSMIDFESTVNVTGYFNTSGLNDIDLVLLGRIDDYGNISFYRAHRAGYEYKPQYHWFWMPDESDQLKDILPQLLARKAG